MTRRHPVANVFFTAHAENEIKIDRLTTADVLQALRGCRVIEMEPSARYKTEGRTAMGEAVAVVVQILTPGESRQRAASNHGLEDKTLVSCDNCHSDKLATRILPEYRTDALGLPNVTLIGIAQELYCRDCGETPGG